MDETVEQKSKRLMKQRKAARYHARWIVSNAKAWYAETGNGHFSWMIARANAVLDALSDTGKYPVSNTRRDKRK